MVDFGPLFFCSQHLLPSPYRWNELFIKAKLSMVDRAAKLDEVGELIEKDLCLLGCTAIEDKLQEGVPQCIKTLATAGIRLWVLTGDKMVRLGGCVDEAPVLCFGHYRFRLCLHVS